MPPLRTLLVCLAVAAAAPAPVAGQSEYFFPAGETFDPDVPSPEAFLGYPVGSLHTRHDRIVAYMRELARASDRATYQEIGTTYEHRVMPVLTVTAPENHRRLEEIRSAHLAALHPSNDGEGAASRPVIVHLGYGVHGNETSSSEAAMLTAYWLVAGTSPAVQRYLREGVFHVEPSLNPDGRDRHTHWANMHRAQPFVADPLDREHNEVWPGGRTNHYWFDLNRDWLPLVNPESRARIDFHHRWRPHVVTDYHEMGAGSTYFFEPSEPVGSWNPLLPERLYTDITVDFAAYWAAALDEVGSLYFTKEIYDNTYPGYGSTYPNFLGGLGLVFEQASARGHVQESPHHGVLTFPFAIRNHVRTSLATVRASVEEKEELAGYQRDFFRSALDEADAYPVTGWVFGDRYDVSLNQAFLDLLLRHRIEVYGLAETRSVDGVTFEAGRSWVVPARQPMYRLARSVFERTETFADSVFYDASAWTVSLAYGMPDGALTGDLPLGPRLTEVPNRVMAGAVPRSSVAYLIDWRDSGAVRALRMLHEAGIRVEAGFAPFTARTAGGDVAFGRGSLSVPLGIQTLGPDSVHAAVSRAREATGVAVRSAASGYAAAGPDLGSRSFRPVRDPRILMPVGDGVSAYEAGQIWHLLDTRIGQPVTKIDVSDLGRADLSDYDVVILVSGAQGAFGGGRLDALRAWIRAGGTLVATRTAAAWAARSELTPNIAAPGNGGGAGADGGDPDAPPARRDYALAGEAEGAQVIGGSIWEADLDVTHPLGFGYTRRFLPVWRDHGIFFEPSDNAYSTVAALVEGDPHLSGYASAANRARLAGSPSVLADRLGGGSVVLLVDNPNFRGYWRGTTRLLLNAIYFGDHVETP